MDEKKAFLEWAREWSEKRDETVTKEQIDRIAKYDRTAASLFQMFYAAENALADYLKTRLSE